ncbi:MAG: hypothetical protein DWH93_00920 [Planctomycetota bacterium]|nr:MAG: hypothetical protein DWH93_00920 [Planctomycetota bacterium]
MQGDDFPSTHSSWMFDLLSTGPTGLAGLRTRIMERYHGALVAYATHAIAMQVLDPQDLVNEFFANRLAKPDYFERWQSSGLPFRRWLINGLHFSAREMLKATGTTKQRMTSDRTDSTELEPPDCDTAADRAFERQFALQVITRCAAAVERGLAAKGRPRDWSYFWRHHIDGTPYRLLAAETGLGPRELNSAIRAVTSELRTAVRLELLIEGLAEHEVERELRLMEEALRP